MSRGVTSSNRATQITSLVAHAGGPSTSRMAPACSRRDSKPARMTGDARRSVIEVGAKTHQVVKLPASVMQIVLTAKGFEQAVPSSLLTRSVRWKSNSGVSGSEIGGHIFRTIRPRR